MKYSIILFFLVFFFLSCDKNFEYEQIFPIKGESWNHNNILHFDVNISDTTNPFNILIDIRNSGKYPYSNIFFFITTHSPNGNMVKDTFEIKLADDRGKWFGNGMGNLYNYQAYYIKNIKFPFKGVYTFDIQHAMWNEDLKGISDIGLRLEKIK